MKLQKSSPLWALALLIPLSAYGEEVVVGSRVYVKSDAEATVDNQIIDVETIPYPAYVERVDGKWLWLGNVRILRSNVFDADEAILHFTDAIEKDPAYSFSYLMRAMVWHGEGKFSNAVDDTTSALTLDPMNITALCNRANALGRLKDFDGAIDDYSAVIKSDPNHAHSFNNRGICFEYLKKYDKAIEDFTEAIRLTPKNPVAYDNLAWLRATCPDEQFRSGKEAVSLAKTSAEITKWQVARVLDTLAAAYAESGDFTLAVEWQVKAVGLAKDKAEKSRYSERLKLYEMGEPFRKGLLGK